MSVLAGVPERLRGLRRSGIMTLVIALAVDAGYLRLIAGQDTGFSPRVAAVAASIAAFGTAAVVAARVPDPLLRAGVAAFASWGLLFLGILGMFSIGLPLLVAGALALGPWIDASRAVRSGWLASAVGTTLACAVLVAVGAT